MHIGNVHCTLHQDVWCWTSSVGVGLLLNTGMVHHWLRLLDIFVFKAVSKRRRGGERALELRWGHSLDTQGLEQVAQPFATLETICCKKVDVLEDSSLWPHWCVAVSVSCRSYQSKKWTNKRNKAVLDTAPVWRHADAITHLLMSTQQTHHLRESRPVEKLTCPIYTLMPVPLGLNNSLCIQPLPFKMHRIKPVFSHKICAVTKKSPNTYPRMLSFFNHFAQVQSLGHPWALHHDTYLQFSLLNSTHQKKKQKVKQQKKQSHHNPFSLGM